MNLSISLWHHINEQIVLDRVLRHLRREKGNSNKMINSQGITIRAVSTIEHDATFSRACFSPDGQIVITKCDTGFHFWSTDTGAPVDAPKIIDSDVISYTNSAFWKGTLVQRESEGALQMQANKVAEESFGGWNDMVVLSPNEAHVAVGSGRGRAFLIGIDGDMPTELLGHESSYYSNTYQNSIWAMLFDSSSTYLITTADEDGRPLLWDLRWTGKKHVWQEKPGRILDEPIEIRPFLIAPPESIQFSPTELKFVTTYSTYCRFKNMAHV